MPTGLPDFNRRNFIKVTSIGAAAMLVGCSTHSPPKISGIGEKSENLGLFVRISKDNQITIISPASEMGQGTHTAHAMLIAEELDCLLYTSPSPRDLSTSRMPSSA